ncbi:MAG: 16S rRNA (adenine(1518)-N(6)/adenine(1519)-N(6))-dimethyltransferase RsmA [Pseudomonadota bacterium]
MKQSPPKHQARKRFGQNFLTDPSVISAIEDAIRPQATEHLVEIGPGLGALTRELLPSGCRLDAIELDRDLATPLLAAFSIYENFSLHKADALKFDFSSLASNETRLRVVGNLPYNISTPLIFHLLDQYQAIQDMHFMLQLEVVQRLTAKPGSKHWGRLGIMCQLRCATEMLFEVPPSAFSPAPKVKSAIVRLTPNQVLKHTAEELQHIEKLVQAAFAQRRKTLRNNLKGILTENLIQAQGVDPGARAETLDVDDFAKLALRTGTRA